MYHQGVVIRIIRREDFNQSLREKEFSVRVG